MNKIFIQMKKYWWVWGGILTIFILIGVLAVVTTINSGVERDISTSMEINEKRDGETTPTGDQDMGEEMPREDMGQGSSGKARLVLKNSGFLEDFVGSEWAQGVIELITTKLAEKLTPGEYTAFAAGSDVERSVWFPFDTLSFVLQVSNGENYDVHIALMKDAYYGLIVGAAGGGDGELYIEYLRPAAKAGYSEEKAAELLNAWTESVGR